MNNLHFYLPSDMKEMDSPTKAPFLALPFELKGIILSNLPFHKLNLLLHFSTINGILKESYTFWQRKHDSCLPSILFHRSKTTFISRLRSKYLNRRFIKQGTSETRQDIYTTQFDITQVQYDSNKGVIYLSSDDQTINIIKDNQIIGKLVGHHGGVWTFMARGDILVSGSTDKTIRVWDLKSNTCKYVLSGHRSTVRCLKLDDVYIISGGRDGEIRVWKHTGECVYVLKGHSASVRCIDIRDNFLVSGSYDGMVILWDFKRGERIKNLKTHAARVYCVKITDKYIVSSGQCGNIFVSNFDGEFMYLLKYHRSIVIWVEIQNGFLYSSGGDNTFVKWDLNTGEIVFTIKENAHITVMKSKDSLLVLGTNNCVKLYDLKTGLFLRSLIEEKDQIFDADFVDNVIVIGFKDSKGTAARKLVYKKI